MKLLQILCGSLRDVPLASKLTRVLMVMSSVAGLLAIVMLTSWQVREIRVQEKEKLEAVLDVVAAQEASAIIFDDRSAANEDLVALLDASPTIQRAEILLRGGSIFTQCVRKSTAATVDDYFQMTLTAPVYKDGVWLGELQLHAHPVGMMKKMMLQAVTVLTMIALSVAVTMLMFSHIAKSIVEPLGRVMHAATMLGTGRFDQYVDVHSRDEAGLLAAAFNEMTENLKKITVSRDYMEKVIHSMMDALVVVSPGGKIQAVNQATLRLLGYREEELLHYNYGILFGEEEADPDQLFRQHGLDALIDQGTLLCVATALVRKDGGEISVLLSGSLMHDNHGGIEGVVCVATDITERKAAEEQVRKSLAEKELLLRELHHRVKNNMQVIISLLGLEARETRSEGVRDALLESQNRVRAMGLVHERLYCSRDLANVDFHEYISMVVQELRVAFGTERRGIRLDLQLDSVLLGIDQAVPCGLLINELITNALKHAFPDDRSGTVTIVLREDPDGMVTIRVADDGVGLGEQIDVQQSKSLGLRLVTSLLRQLQGTLEVSQEHGACFDMMFKKR